MSKQSEQRNRGATYRRSAWLNMVIAASVLVLIAFGVSGLNVNVDLTANKRFSVNPATIKILQSVKTPIALRFYLSEERPADMAGLESDMLARLTAISKAAGPDAIRFNPDKDLVRIEDTSAWRKENATKGVKEIKVRTARGEFSYVASLELSHESMQRPLQISVTRPDAMEYRLALAAVRIADIPHKPASIEAQIAAIQQEITITYYTSGLKRPSEGKERTPLPPEAGNLRRNVREILDEMAKISKGKLKIQEEDRYDRREFRDANDIARIERDGKSIAFYSTIYVDDGKNAPRKIPYVQDPAFVAKNVMRVVWEMMQPRKQIGVYTPRSRPELTKSEAALLGYDADQPATPERVVSSYLSARLGYDVVPVPAGVNFLAQEIAALVIVRPSQLSDRDLYDIKAYLAGGGKVLLFHGTWHLTLADTGIKTSKFEGGKTRWIHGKESGQIQAARMRRTLEGYLKTLGISSEGQLLVASAEALQASVFAAPIGDGENQHLPPRQIRASAPFIPFASSVEGGHLLASQIPALPLSGGTTFKVDQEQAKRSGVSVETLLYAPEGSQGLSADLSTEKLLFNYLSAPNEPFENLWVGHEEAKPVAGAPVALIIEGQFPFDASIAPPPKSSDDKNRYQAPGDNFTAAKGQLVVVGAPNLFDPMEVGAEFPAPWGRREPSLLASQASVLESSRTRLLSNIVDTMVYGEELLEVRSSLTPTARRLEAWSAKEKLMWTLLIVGLVPALVAVGGVCLMVRRRKRRAAYEEKHQALGREALKKND